MLCYLNIQACQRKNQTIYIKKNYKNIKKAFTDIVYQVDMMSDAVEQAQIYIEKEDYKQALKLARKRHGKDDIEEYIAILDLLIDDEYLPALEEKECTTNTMMKIMTMETTAKNILMNIQKSNLDQLMQYVTRHCPDSTREKSMRQLNTWTRLMTNTNPIPKLKSPESVKTKF